MTKIAVVDYGMGNIHSMIKALRLYHNDVIFTGEHNVLKSSGALVLPGDGAFGKAMEHLDNGLADIITEHIKKERPLLGVCIGFQILFQDSDEVTMLEDGEGVGVTEKEVAFLKGLGLVPGNIRTFPKYRKGPRVPHMGWNRLAHCRARMTDYEGQHVYFIHSHRPEGVPDEFVIAQCSYGSSMFPAAVQKGSIFATQFHPEKSDKVGLSMIENWVRDL